MNLEHGIDDVHDPVFLKAGARIESRLESPVQSQAGIRDLDDQSRRRRVLVEVVRRRSGNDGDIRLRLRIVVERERRMKPRVPPDAERQFEDAPDCATVAA